MSAFSLGLITLVLSSGLVAFGLCMARIAARADRNTPTQQNAPTQNGEGDRAAAVSAPRPSPHYMPGAPELYFDKFPRKQRVAKRSVSA